MFITIAFCFLFYYNCEYKPTNGRKIPDPWEQGSLEFIDMIQASPQFSSCLRAKPALYNKTRCKVGKDLTSCPRELFALSRSLSLPSHVGTGDGRFESDDPERSLEYLRIQFRDGKVLYDPVMLLKSRRDLGRVRFLLERLSSLELPKGKFDLLYQPSGGIEKRLDETLLVPRSNLDQSGLIPVLDFDEEYYGPFSDFDEDIRRILEMSERAAISPKEPIAYIGKSFDVIKKLDGKIIQMPREKTFAGLAQTLKRTNYVILSCEEYGLLGLLSIGVVILKEKCPLKEYYENLLSPGTHLLEWESLEELKSMIQWVRGNPRNSKLIAKQSLEFARTILRQKSMECWYHIVLEKMAHLSQSTIVPPISPMAEELKHDLQTYG